VDPKIEELLIRLARENEAIDSHLRAYPVIHLATHATYVDRMTLIGRREQTLDEISQYSTVYAKATGKL
jgi:hypothetical protein